MKIENPVNASILALTKRDVVFKYNIVGVKFKYINRYVEIDVEKMIFFSLLL